MPDAAIAPRTNVIGVITRDRQASLIACVESYLANCRRRERRVEVVVMDDTASRGPSASDVARVTRARLRALTDGERTIRYAGEREKRRFADALARESAVPRPVIEFGLFGDSRCGPLIGANRNNLLLDTVDSLVFGVDDDTVGRVGRAPESTEPLAFSSAYEPREFWLFGDRRAAVEAVREINADFLADHDRLLGTTIAGDGSGRSGRIVLTLPGLVGDSGMGSPRFLLTLEGPSRERLVASRDDYRSAMRSREVLRTAVRPTVSDSAFCMTTFFGLDNRHCLPPFFPVARNSDGIFGLTLRKTIEGGRTAFVPSVLLHAPPETRAFVGDEAWTEPARIRMADVLIASIIVHDPGGDGSAGGDPARIRRLGAYLRDLASLGANDFEAFVTSAQQLRNLTLTNVLETRLTQYGGQPAFWADDVKRTIELLRRAAADRDYVAPRDLGTIADAAESRSLSRELVARYGNLLEAWPALVDAARRLRKQNIRISAPI